MEQPLLEVQSVGRNVKMNLCPGSLTNSFMTEVPIV